MAGELFGFAAGSRLYDEDQADLALRAAHTRLYNAQAGAAEDKAAQGKQAQALLARLGSGQDPSFMGPPEVPDTVSILNKQAQALAAAGLPNEAAKVAKGAADITLKGQQEETSAARKRYLEAQVAKQTLSEVNALASGITDEASFNRARMNFMANHPEARALPPVFQRYDQAAVDQLVASTAEGLKRIEVELRAEDVGSKVAARESQAEFRKTRAGYMQEVLRLRREREANRAKAAGDKVKDPGSPVGSEVSQARNLIRKEIEGGDSLPPEELSEAAFNVASRARQLRKAHAGLDAGEAMRQALEEARGDFETVAKTFLGFERGKEARYRQPKTADKPVALPPDRKSLVVGQVYNTAKGPAKWTGQNFVAASPASRAAPLPEDNEDDNEEGEEED
jgi:hypothetical protein